MKSTSPLVLIFLLVCVGCSANRLIFLEESHLGLKAKFSANSPSPYEFDIGYRRGVIATIPMQSEKPPSDGNQMVDKGQSQKDAVEGSSAEDSKPVVTIYHDPDELMSMYVTFKANIGFNDPIQVCHFLATGKASASLLADAVALRNLNPQTNCHPPNDSSPSPTRPGS